MTDSPTVAIPLWTDTVLQRELVHNESINILEVISPIVVKEMFSTLPTSAPANGDRYIVSTAGSSGFALQGNNIAAYYDGWFFVVPVEGWKLFDQTSNSWYYYNGSNWISGFPVENVYDIALYQNGNYTAGDIVFSLLFPYSAHFVDDFVGSQAYSGGGATTSKDFKIWKNGIKIGDITFTSTSNNGAFATSSTTVESFSIGDRLDLVAPDSTDSALTDIAITFKGQRDE